MYSIFCYNMINIQVLFIIRVLIILKHLGDLDFECYIYIYIYIYNMCVCVCGERERERALKKVIVNYDFLNFLQLLRDLRNSYYAHFCKEQLFLILKNSYSQGIAILCNESVTKQPNSYSIGIAITLQDLLQCTKRALYIFSSLPEEINNNVNLEHGCFHE